VKFNFKNVQRRQLGLTALFSLVFAALLLPFFWDMPLMASVLGGLMGAGTNDLRQRYVRVLRARIESESEISWDVELNDVKVGTITDSEYAAIRLKVFSDVNNYVAQLCNFGKFALMALDKSFLAIPLMLFWAGVAFAVISPDALITFISDFQKAEPAAKIFAAKGMVQAMCQTMLFAMVLLAALGYNRSGFVNKFAEATYRIVRKRCNVAAEGNMTLVRLAEGVLLFNDELAYVRTSRNDKT